MNFPIKKLSLRIGVLTILTTLIHGAVFSDDREEMLLQQLLFDDENLLDVAIYLNPTDWEELRTMSRQLNFLDEKARMLEPVEIFEYYPGDVYINGVFFDNVGIRKKGFFGSMDPNRPSLKIKFNKYKKGESLAGLKLLTLNNNKQDPSQLNQYLAYRIFRDIGVPASRCGFARVFVNGDYLGVYSNVESVDRSFVQRHFGTEKGNLYEGALSDFFPNWAGNFETKISVKENKKRDIHRLSSALLSDDSKLLETLEQALEIDQFLSFWAAEVLLGHWDGYTGNRNNFFIFRPHNDGRFTFIPWGADQLAARKNPAFWDFTPPKSIWAGSAVTHRLYAHPDGQKLYRQRFRELLENHWDEAGLIADLRHRQNLLKPHLTIPIEEHEKAFQKLITFIQNRRDEVAEELDGPAPVWPRPAVEPPLVKEIGEVKIHFDAKVLSKSPLENAPIFENPDRDSNAGYKMRLDGKDIVFLNTAAFAHIHQGGSKRVIFVGELPDKDGDCLVVGFGIPENAWKGTAEVNGFYSQINLNKEGYKFLGTIHGPLQLKKTIENSEERISGEGRLAIKIIIQKEVIWNQKRSGENHGG